MKKWLPLIIGACAIAMAAWGWTSVRQPASELPARETVKAASRDIASVVKATGVIKPMIGAEVRVGSRVSGVVNRLYVRVGDSVTKGQLLAQLDTRELAAREREAIAALELAEANEDFAIADLRRKKEIGAAGLISASELDLAGRARAVAGKQRAGADASLAYARTQLGHAQIVAPISGVVSSMSTQEGETVAASFAAPTFVTLLDLNRLEVWAYVDETDIGRIHAGQQVRFTVDTYGNQEFEGEITTIYPQAEIRDNVVNYVAVVRFVQPEEQVLRPEMTTTVTIIVDQREHVLTVPLRAVQREAGRAFVLTPGEKTYERRWIRTGSRDDSYWEVSEGLREGDEVIVGTPKAE